MSDMGDQLRVWDDVVLSVISLVVCLLEKKWNMYPVRYITYLASTTDAMRTLKIALRKNMVLLVT